MGYSIALPRSHTWQKRPGGPIGIIPGRTPRGLQYCWPFSDVAFSELLKGAKPSNRGSTISFASCPYGQGLKMTSATTSTISYPIKWPSLSTPFSMEVLLYPTAIVPVNTDIMTASDASTPASNVNSSFGIGAITSSTNIQAWVNNSGTLATGVASVANSLQHAVAAWNGVTLTIYQNGVSKGTAAVASPLTINGTAFIQFGNDNGSDLGPPAYYLLANLATVAWSASEVRARYADPFGFLLYQEDLLFGRSTSGTTLTIDRGLPLEFLAALNGNGLVPAESVGTIVAVPAGYLELLSAQQRDAGTFIEALENVAAGLLQIEFIGSSKNDTPAQAEALAGQITDRGVIDETLAGQRLDGPAITENPASQNVDRPVPSEDVGSIVGNATAQTEDLAAVQPGSGIAVENLLSVRQDGRSAIEFASLVAAIPGLPVEWGGAIVVMTDGLAPAEWLGALRSDRPVAAEWQVGLILDRSIAIEALHGLMRDGIAPVEVLRGLVRDAGVSAEWLGSITGTSLTADGLVSLEFGSGLVSQQAVPLESLTRVFFDRAIPEEWGFVSVTVGGILLPIPGKRPRLHSGGVADRAAQPAAIRRLIGPASRPRRS